MSLGSLAVAVGRVIRAVTPLACPIEVSAVSEQHPSFSVSEVARGDLLVAVDGESVLGWSIRKTNDLLLGGTVKSCARVHCTIHII